MSVTEQELWNFVDGADGTGMSPYDIWLSLGNEGTAQDFLNYLRGGTDGASPYEIWKSIYGGTQQEYLNFLRGEGMSVIDNLESNSATHSLSARQGKVLKNNRIVSLDEIDLVTEEGFFADALSVKELKETLINGIVDNLTSTDINKPISANQARLLHERDNTQQSYIDSCLNNLSGLSSKTNLLLVNLSNPTAEINSVHRIYAEDASVLIGSPVTSGIFIAKWECIWYTDRRLIVKLTEFYPNYGRVWQNHYNYKDWDGWRLVGGSTVAAGSQGFTALTGSTNNSYLRKDQSTGRVDFHFEVTGMDTNKTALNLAFATIPANYRPNRNITIFATCWDNAESKYTQVLIRITTSGNVVQIQSELLKLTDIYFDACWYTNFDDYTVFA